MKSKPIDSRKVPDSVVGYYAVQDAEHMELLLQLRRSILEIIPDASEVIKYGMPTFILDGVPVAGIMAHKNHVGFYPYSGSVINQFPNLLNKYKCSKGAVQIPLTGSLSKAWLSRLIKARILLG